MYTINLMTLVTQMGQGLKESYFDDFKTLVALMDVNFDTSLTYGALKQLDEHYIPIMVGLGLTILNPCLMLIPENGLYLSKKWIIIYIYNICIYMPIEIF